MTHYLKFNCNDYVKVKLTDVGYAKLACYWGGVIPDSYKDYTDKDGWIKFQMHVLMHIFGDVMYMGNNKLPFEMDMKIEIKEG